MNGNVTQEGIRLDLQWLQRIGVGGVQTFDTSFETPQVVPKRLTFMTPPWKNAFLSATRLAEQLHLELGIGSSPGSSETGGPWVRPAEAMKKFVWAETRVTGGRRFYGRPAQPPTVVGPFQDIPVDRSGAGLGGPPPLKPIPNWYRDIAVVAYRLPDGEQSMAQAHPDVTSSGGGVAASQLWNDKYAQPVTLLEGTPDSPSWIQADFGHRVTIQSVSVGLQDTGIVWGPPRAAGLLESSEDGIRFEPVSSIYDSADDPQGFPFPLQETITFPPKTARFFRLVISPSAVTQSDSAWEGFIGAQSTGTRITKFELHTTPRVDHFEKKAGYFLGRGLNAHATIPVATRDAIDPGDIADLTTRMRADGTLDWTPPAGEWVILRAGYSLLGITNHPAPPEGTGLEVDKLSRVAVARYLDQYLALYHSVLGSGLMGAHGLSSMVNDSYEAGPQNWTDDLPQQFARRRGYALRPWLPALTGRIIGSSERTDRFLWDFRRTLGELISEAHYGEVSRALHARGMRLYSESHEVERAFIGDGMDVKRSTDIPMGAMWMPGFPLEPQSQGDADIRESASVAHLYGQNIVAAESMTDFGQAGTAYGYAPETLKPTVDREFLDGVNLIVVHTSVHQPLVEGAPGITLGPFGQWFTRNETWAPLAGPWISYLARSSFLLQQGHFVADILYFYGQDSNITALFGKNLPTIPKGFAFDFASADALSRLMVQGDRLVSPAGTRYRMLVLDPRARTISLDVLRSIARLVSEGATVVGDKSERTPSLADDPEVFRALADELWGKRGTGQHRYGRGQVISGLTLDAAIATLQIEPDVTDLTGDSEASVGFVHRQLGDGDLYFISNQRPKPQHVEARFRVASRAPEIWRADSGAIEATSYRRMGDTTLVPLNLEPNDSVFVVFRQRTQIMMRDVPDPMRQTLAAVSGPWTLRFQGPGAPAAPMKLPQLKSWSTFDEPGIRYFSGTARYETSVEIPETWLDRDQRVQIDLGDVKNVAQVLVNGASAGVLWKAPFRVDLTSLLHPGTNQLAVEVTNLWPNRLIGDKQPGATAVSLTTFNPYTADSPLLMSGLLGPVTLSSLPAPNPARATGTSAR